MIEVKNPSTDELIATLEVTNESALNKKFAQAKSQQVIWAKQPFSKRKDIIQRFRGLLADKLTQGAQTMSREMGKPLSQAQGELSATLARIDWFLQQTESVILPDIAFEDQRMTEMISYDPLGVIANISAWNFPYFVGSNVFIPALLCGNAVLYKPSEVTSLTGQFIETLFQEAGLPEGLFQLVLGTGQTGQQMLDLDINGAFFTGSYATGQKIAAQCGPKMIKMQLELGGKDPAYVRSDADLNLSVERVFDGIFYNAGQSCCAVERLYLHCDIYDAFIELLTQAADKIVVGDPFDPKTTMGPLARKEQLTLLEKQCADAEAKGAQIVWKYQNELPTTGSFFAPRIYSNCSHKMDLMREESFAPIIGIQKVSSDQEALELMNDTDFGLTASVHTGDLTVAKHLLRHVDCGTVYANSCDRVSPYLPWSGRKNSGIGSTLSILGVQTFVQPKAWHLRSDFNFD